MIPSGSYCKFNSDVCIILANKNLYICYVLADILRIFAVNLKEYGKQLHKQICMADRCRQKT